MCRLVLSLFFNQIIISSVLVHKYVYHYDRKKTPTSKEETGLKLKSIQVCWFLSKLFSTAGKWRVPCNLIDRATVKTFSVHDNCVWLLNFRFWNNVYSLLDTLILRVRTNLKLSLHLQRNKHFQSKRRRIAKNVNFW